MSDRLRSAEIPSWTDGVDLSAGAAHYSWVNGGEPATDSAPDDAGELYGAQLVIPLALKEEIYGGLMFYYREPRRLSSQELELAVMFGEQTKLAIENARLRAQSEQLAVTAERNRIARDLHDSVTQTLFSASLIAEVLPRIWDKDRTESKRRLDELRELTRGALAEMRTLLLELRPATLVEVDLNELLRQLTEAAVGRARIPIELAIEGAAPIPPDVKIAFYHIAQEALNNVTKHARASHAAVTLRRRTGSLYLSIRDDGRGFEPTKVTPQHLGLTIMQERSDAIQAELAIKSAPGCGAEITVTWRQPT
jgi:signal transduction histidine kinase